MKIDEIVIFADKRTFSHERTIVKLKNGKELVGFFDNNAPSRGLRKLNKWNFIVLQFKHEGRKQIELIGDDILSIDIISLI